MKKAWCPRGRRYTSEMDLKLAMAERIVKEQPALPPYECDYCEAYHLGMPAPVFDICPHSGKRIFKTEKAAQDNLRAMQRRRKANRMEKRVYPCPKCGNWHSTSDGTPG